MPPPPLAAVSAPAPSAAADALIPVSPGAGALKDENLLVPLPPGFKVGAAGRPGSRQQMVEFVPLEGYPVSLWMFSCPMSAKTGRPESLVMKAISGADSLYDVQYAHRAVESPQTVTPAVAYLKQVKVCDARRADRPCPTVGPRPEAPQAR